MKLEDLVNNEYAQLMTALQSDPLSTDVTIRTGFVDLQYIPVKGSSILVSLVVPSVTTELLGCDRLILDKLIVNLRLIMCLKSNPTLELMNKVIHFMKTQQKFTEIVVGEVLINGSFATVNVKTSKSVTWTLSEA